jgi:hypothetical protein
MDQTIRREIAMRILRALSLSVFIFGFAGWVYVAGNSWFHPESLSWPLTHLLPWPREDTFGVACFAASFASFFIWSLIRSPKN